MCPETHSLKSLSSSHYTGVIYGVFCGDTEIARTSFGYRTAGDVRGGWRDRMVAKHEIELLEARVAELEAERNSMLGAYDEGWSEGYSEGRQDGRLEGEYDRPGF